MQALGALLKCNNGFKVSLSSPVDDAELKPWLTPSRVLIALLVAAWICVDVNFVSLNGEPLGLSPGRGLHWFAYALAAQLALLSAWLVWGRIWFVARFLALAGIIVGGAWVFGSRSEPKIIIVETVAWSLALILALRGGGVFVTRQEAHDIKRPRSTVQFSLSDLLSLSTVLAVGLAAGLWLAQNLNASLTFWASGIGFCGFIALAGVLGVILGLCDVGLGIMALVALDASLSQSIGYRYHLELILLGAGVSSLVLRVAGYRLDWQRERSLFGGA